MQVRVGKRGIKSQSLVDFLDACNFVGVNDAIGMCCTNQRCPHGGLVVLAHLLQFPPQKCHVRWHGQEPFKVCAKPAAFLIAEGRGRNLIFQRPAFRLRDATISMGDERPKCQFDQGASIAVGNFLQSFDGFTQTKQHNRLLRLGRPERKPRVGRQTETEARERVGGSCHLPFSDLLVRFSLQSSDHLLKRHQSPAIDDIACPRFQALHFL